MNRTPWGIILEALNLFMVPIAIIDIATAQSAFISGAGPLRVLTLVSLSAGTAFLIAVLNHISD